MRWNVRFSPFTHKIWLNLEKFGKISLGQIKYPRNHVYYDVEIFLPSSYQFNLSFEVKWWNHEKCPQYLVKIEQVSKPFIQPLSQDAKVCVPLGQF